MNAALDREIESLERLAMQICEAAREGNLDALDERIRQRWTLLDRLAVHVSETARGSASTDVTRDRLAAILEVDREAERILEDGRVALEARLAALAEGRRGLRGYASGSGSAGKRVDERG